MQDLTGKVAFITGGASGIGLGMARTFLAERMKVVLADWNEEHIARAKDTLQGSNAAHFVKTNVADRANLRSAAEEALEVFGKIHVLCNNAGVNGGGTADAEDFDGWDKALAVNLGGVINGTKIVVPMMKRQGEGGHVVNTSSMAGVVPLPGLAAYSTAKYAVRGYSESLRIQLAPEGIGVSCLFPGATRTALVPVPEDAAGAHIDPGNADPFMHALWDAMRAAVDPLDTGRAVVDAIRENRFYIFTNREFLDEVKQRHREIEDAFPDQDPPEGRVRFETMRAEMVRNLMAAGHRATGEGGSGFGLDLNSPMPDRA